MESRKRKRFFLPFPSLFPSSLLASICSFLGLEFFQCHIFISKDFYSLRLHPILWKCSLTCYYLFGWKYLAHLTSLPHSMLTQLLSNLDPKQKKTKSLEKKRIGEKGETKGETNKENIQIILQLCTFLFRDIESVSFLLTNYFPGVENLREGLCQSFHSLRDLSGELMNNERSFFQMLSNNSTTLESLDITSYYHPSPYPPSPHIFEFPCKFLKLRNFRISAATRSAKLIAEDIITLSPNLTKLDLFASDFLKTEENKIWQILSTLPLEVLSLHDHLPWGELTMSDAQKFPLLQSLTYWSPSNYKSSVISILCPRLKELRVIFQCRRIDRFFDSFSENILSISKLAFDSCVGNNVVSGFFLDQYFEMRSFSRGDYFPIMETTNNRVG